MVSDGLSHMIGNIIAMNGFGKLRYIIQLLHNKCRFFWFAVAMNIFIFYRIEQYEYDDDGHYNRPIKSIVLW